MEVIMEERLPTMMVAVVTDNAKDFNTGHTISFIGVCKLSKMVGKSSGLHALERRLQERCLHWI